MTATARVGVMQITDTLDIGGAEHVAVNLANQLPREQFRSYLCTTRREGPLADQLSHDVGRLCLNRRQRLDFNAIRRLADYVKRHRIAILHAHGSALFVAGAASLLPPHPLVIWHDHFGRYLSEALPHSRKTARRRHRRESGAGRVVAPQTAYAG